MKMRLDTLAGVVLLTAALACSGGGSQRAGSGFGDAPPADSADDGGLTSRSSGEGLVGEGVDLERGDRPALEGDLPVDGQFELAITEEMVESGMTAALQQAGYLGEDESVRVDIRRDETILTRFPYTIEETGSEVSAELVYTVFVEGDGSIGVELISASFKTAQGLSIDLPAERMEVLNAAVEAALEMYSGSAAEMGATLTDIGYSDTAMTLVGTAAP